MRYDYHMVQVPPSIEVRSKDYAGNEAAAYLQGLADHYAEHGWDFYRVDVVGVRTKPGCLAALFGQRVQDLEFYVVTFRRENTTAD